MRGDDYRFDGDWFVVAVVFHRDFAFPVRAEDVVVLHEKDACKVADVGSDDMTKLPKKMVPTFTGSYKYKIRKTSYVCVFGIYINR